jgi:Transcriptional regulatory protein, C terminal
VVSAEELLEHAWDANLDPFGNVVSVTVARLRRKLGRPPPIDTVVGRGPAGRVAAPALKRFRNCRRRTTAPPA